MTIFVTLDGWSRHTAFMAKPADHYWDLETCSWTRHAVVEVPAQAAPSEPRPTAAWSREPTAVSVAEDGDVRSE